MKKTILFICLLSPAFFLTAQNPVHLVSFGGIDELVSYMSKADLEKLLHTKIVFKHIGIDVQLTETVKATYKGAEMEIDMAGSDSKNASLEGVHTTSPLFKTKEGIGVGSDQQTIIDTYEKHLLIITSGSITLVDIDNLHSSIVFRMENKKVVAIGSEPTAAFRDRE
ncbi:MAG: hypothetical protein ABIT05_07415 [Chitinophagaceae bacterium]